MRLGNGGGSGGWVGRGAAGAIGFSRPGGIGAALRSLLLTALLAALAFVAGVAFVLALVTVDLVDDEAVVGAFGPLLVYASGGLVFGVAAILSPGGWREALALVPWTPGRGFLACLAALLAVLAASEWLEFMFPVLEDLCHGALVAGDSALVHRFGGAGGADRRGDRISRISHTRLRRALPVPFALILTAFLFAAGQYDGAWLYPLLVLPVSLVLGYARERLGSTLPCMILHMIYNAGAVAAELLRI